MTPCGEIAFQLSGGQGFALVEEHDKLKTAPGGDVIRSFLPKDRSQPSVPFFVALSLLSSQISFSR